MRNCGELEFMLVGSFTIRNIFLVQAITFYPVAVFETVLQGNTPHFLGDFSQHFIFRLMAFQITYCVNLLLSSFCWTLGE
jgi:hypothetical protein